MIWNDHGDTNVGTREVNHDEQHLVVFLPHEGKLLPGVELPCLVVGIHQVETFSFPDRLFPVGQAQYLAIGLLQALLPLSESVGSEKFPSDRIHAPVVENGRAAILAREAFLVHATLANLLAEVDHEWVFLQERSHHKGRHGLGAVTAIEVAANALLIVVLKEVEHVILYVVSVLPAPRYAVGRAALAHHVTKAIIHAHLVVQVVETRGHIPVILVRVVDLTDEDELRETLLHYARGISPKFRRHHLRHVAAEAVDAFLRPKEQDVGHLLPRVGHGGEVMASATGIAIVDTVVELYRLIPIILARLGVKLVVASAFGRVLHIRLLAIGWLHGAHESVARTIIEIVLRVKMLCRVVIRAQVAHAFGKVYAMIFTRHVVWHEVYYHLHACLVGALHESLKLRHALRHVLGQVWVHVVIIGYGIG